MFLILGALTSGFGLLLVPILPDSPAKAIFLTKTERAIAVQRTLENKTGVLDNGTFNWKQALEALKDPQAWFLVLYTFCVNLWNGGLTTVSLPQVDSSFNPNIIPVPRNHHQGVRLWNVPIASLPGAIWRRRNTLSYFHSHICYLRSLKAHILWLVAYLHDDLQHRCLINRCPVCVEA